MSYLNDGTITVSLHLSWNTTRDEELLLSRRRTVGGNDSYTLWTNVPKFTLPVEWVPASDAMQINDWWGYSKPLTFYFESDQTSYSCIITGTEPPFYQVEKPYSDVFKGVILIEAK